MNAREAIEILEQIPEDKFVTGNFAEADGKCCAIGHLVREKINPSDLNNDTCADNPVNPYYDSHEEEIKEISNFCRDTLYDFMKDVHDLPWVDLASVNNAPECNGYTEESIKERVLHCLRDVAEWEKQQELVEA